MTNVRTLDLAYLSGDNGHPLASRYPNALFPRATSIRLSGMMQYALAASILAANPAKLENLVWDNVQQPRNSQFLCDQAIAIDRPLYQTQIWALWNNHHNYWRSESEYFAEPGPMHNLLGFLAGRCTSLKSLTLRKTAEVGRRFSSDRSEFEQVFSWLDEDIYREFAVFIEAQKGTLQRLEFEQGPRDFEFPKHCVPWRLRGAYLMRFMDCRFQKYIWPVLMDQKGDWPCLTHLSIKGVKHWYRTLDTQPLKTMVRSKFGDSLSVVIKEESEVMDHIGMGVME